MLVSQNLRRPVCRMTNCPLLPSAKASSCQETLAVIIILINRSIDSYLWDMSYIKLSHRLGVNVSGLNGVI